MNGVAFVSDVHVRFGDQGYLEAFLRFLRHVPSIARSLYIHGDLFDFYIGEKQGRLEFYRPLFDTLGQLVGDGVAVGVLAGNRDFLLDRSFQRRRGHDSFRRGAARPRRAARPSVARRSVLRARQELPGGAEGVAFAAREGPDGGDAREHGGLPRQPLPGDLQAEDRADAGR